MFLQHGFDLTESCFQHTYITLLWDNFTGEFGDLEMEYFAKRIRLIMLCECPNITYSLTTWHLSWCRHGKTKRIWRRKLYQQASENLFANWSIIFYNACFEKTLFWYFVLTIYPTLTFILYKRYNQDHSQEGHDVDEFAIIPTKLLDLIKQDDKPYPSFHYKVGGGQYKPHRKEFDSLLKFFRKCLCLRQH